MNPKTVAEIERLRRQLREDPAPPMTSDAKEVIAARDPQPAELRLGQIHPENGTRPAAEPVNTGCWRERWIGPSPPQPVPECRMEAFWKRRRGFGGGGGLL